MKIYLGALTVLMLILASCYFARPTYKPRYTPEAHEWIRRPQATTVSEQGEWKDLVETKEYRVLTDAEFSTIKKKLEVAPVIEIKFGEGIKLPKNKSRRYFVLRAAEQPRIARVKSDYYVHSCFLSHSVNIAISKAGVVVGADTPPTNAYMSYSIAE